MLRRASFCGGGAIVRTQIIQTSSSGKATIREPCQAPHVQVHERSSGKDHQDRHNGRRYPRVPVPRQDGIDGIIIGGGILVLFIRITYIQLPMHNGPYQIQYLDRKDKSPPVEETEWNAIQHQSINESQETDYSVGGNVVKFKLRLNWIVDREPPQECSHELQER